MDDSVELFLITFGVATSRAGGGGQPTSQPRRQARVVLTDHFSFQLYTQALKGCHLVLIACVFSLFTQGISSKATPAVHTYVNTTCVFLHRGFPRERPPPSKHINTYIHGEIDGASASMLPAAGGGRARFSRCVGSAQRSTGVRSRLALPVACFPSTT